MLVALLPGLLRLPPAVAAAISLAFVVALWRDRATASQALLLTATLLALAGLAGLFLLLRRISFVVTHGSMDPGTSGSPLAFLIGAAYEQAILTLPAAVVAALTWWAARGPHRTRPAA